MVQEESSDWGLGIMEIIAVRVSVEKEWPFSIELKALDSWVRGSTKCL